MLADKFFMHNNLKMLTDFYELTMSNGYLKNGIENTTAYFDMFYRNTPDNGGFAIMAGLEQLVEYIENLNFNEDDIEYLRKYGIFDEGFLSYLKNFKFSCDIWSVPEGTPIFPGEPIITVVGPIVQAQLIETMLLLTINHQSLIATKTNRIVRAAEGRSVMEFGARRAQGYSGAVYGARASYIGGCDGTSCTLTDMLFGVPAMGTMAHSWIQMFDSELEAFKAYSKLYPNNCSLLVDTYNVLKSGVPNAIKAFNEIILPLGYRPKSIRIDSGDITYLSCEARKMLDDAGFEDCKICASNSLDEYIIRDMITQGAKVDMFGVGERLITSASKPVFGGVYKLAAIKDNKGNIIPKIKISENVTKITNPCFKKVYRLFDNNTDKAIADVLALHDEIIDESKPYKLFDPEYTWKKKVVENFRCVELQKQIFKGGRLIYSLPKITDIREYCKTQLDTLWKEVKRFENPHTYYVDLSEKLWNEKDRLIKENKILVN
jgi:nicotinate phosphoribosyltransferase